jgi:putative transposase
MSRFIHKTHNVSVLLYHFVCPTKYRRSVLSESVEAILVSACVGITEVYEIDFVEIGCDKNHVHFLIQSVPTYSPTKIIRTVKSLIARELFSQLPTLKKQLWGGAFWSSGYYVSTVGRHGSEDGMRRYIAEQGLPDYKPLHEGQLRMFDEEFAS